MKRMILQQVVRMPLFYLTVIIVVVIGVLTLLPMPESGSTVRIPHFDKIVHFIMFGVMGVVVLYDMGRMMHRVNFTLILSAITFAVLYGALVEIMQGYMPAGRSADMADWWADIAGAVICVFAALSLVRWLVGLYVLSFEPIVKSSDISEEIHNLYLSSFPPEERRPWSDICHKLDASDGVGLYHLWLIVSRGKIAGLISWWDLPEAVYVEHFAVDPQLRGRGIGAAAIKRFAEVQGRGVILEVEPDEDSDLAARRIGFYQRCGFTVHRDFEYIQPPYKPGLPSVRLLLMTKGADIPLVAAAETIRTVVYEVSC